jgi:hypothetical protein
MDIRQKFGSAETRQSAMLIRLVLVSCSPGINLQHQAGYLQSSPIISNHLHISTDFPQKKSQHRNKNGCFPGLPMPGPPLSERAAVGGYAAGLVSVKGWILGEPYPLVMSK